ncbi:MAG: low molecular weight protein-tyrosine-phosphatase [Bacteroidota bacterium]|nr:low molecular weight protein-tyrosine-phosphatase [Bacteroidota bacterium]
MKKILMVCLGNICRSPLAEGILRSKLPKTHFSIDSAGTSGFHNGSPPDPRSIEVAKKNGINIDNQKSRPFGANDFESFDLIFVMDSSNHRNVLKFAKSEIERQKVKLILDHPGSKTKEVSDPYYEGDEGSESVFKLIDASCDYHSQRLIKAL